MSRRNWIALADLRDGAFEEAAACPLRRIKRERYGIGDFPFTGDRSAVLLTGGLNRTAIGRSAWHYDYIAAGA